VCKTGPDEWRILRADSSTSWQTLELMRSIASVYRYHRPSTSERRPSVPRYPRLTLNYDPSGPALNQSGRNQSVDDGDDAG